MNFSAPPILRTPKDAIEEEASKRKGGKERSMAVADVHDQLDLPWRKRIVAGEKGKKKKKSGERVAKQHQIYLLLHRVSTPTGREKRNARKKKKKKERSNIADRSAMFP